MWGTCKKKTVETECRRFFHAKINVVFLRSSGAPGLERTSRILQPELREKIMQGRGSLDRSGPVGRMHGSQGRGNRRWGVNLLAGNLFHG